MAISTTRLIGQDYYVHEFDEFAAGALTGIQVGGSDTFYGDSWAYGYAAYGDSYDMGARTKGGNDTFHGGDYVGTDFGTDSLFGSGAQFAGDAVNMFGSAVGGNDYFSGGTNSSNMFGGDAAESMSEQSRGGNDYMYAGDTWAYWWTGDLSTNHFMYGDGYFMGGGARGGLDVIEGGSVTAQDGYSAGGAAYLMGDAFTMGEYAVGGADRIYGADAFAYSSSDAQAFNYIAGDALFQSGASTFGSDVLFGGSAYSDEGYAQIVNYMLGDALSASGAAKFGADKLTGGHGSGDGYAVNLMFGDSAQVGDMGDSSLGAGAMFADALAAAGIVGSEALGAFALPDISISVADTHTPLVYGNDVLIGGEFAVNMMVGDSSTLYAGDRGGNDVLVAGDDSMNMMYGDGSTIGAGAYGGKDRLVSGTGNDVMYGDAASNAGTGGADVFVFAPGNGNDVVADFQVNVDRIDLSAFTASHLIRTFRAFAASGRMEDTGDGVVLHLDADPASESNTVLLAGVHLESLTASSFII